MKTSELTGALLDYWVARAEGYHVGRIVKSTSACNLDYVELGSGVPYRPSMHWAHGGPLLEKYKLCVGEIYGKWECCTADSHYKSSLWSMLRDSDGIEAEGDTPLEAICRAVVRAKFGDKVPLAEDGQDGA